MKEPNGNPLPMPPLSLRIDDLRGRALPDLDEDEMAEYLRWGSELRRQDRQQQYEYEQAVQRDRS